LERDAFDILIDQEYTNTVIDSEMLFENPKTVIESFNYEEKEFTETVLESLSDKETSLLDSLQIIITEFKRKIKHLYTDYLTKDSKSFIYIKEKTTRAESFIKYYNNKTEFLDEKNKEIKDLLEKYKKIDFNDSKFKNEYEKLSDDFKYYTDMMITFSERTSKRLESIYNIIDLIKEQVIIKHKAIKITKYRTFVLGVYRTFDEILDDSKRLKNVEKSSSINKLYYSVYKYISAIEDLFMKLFAFTIEYRVEEEDIKGGVV
jgi:hypothetical protein